MKWIWFLLGIIAVILLLWGVYSYTAPFVPTGDNTLI